MSQCRGPASTHSGGRSPNTAGRTGRDDPERQGLSGGRCALRKLVVEDDVEVILAGCQALQRGQAPEEDRAGRLRLLPVEVEHLELRQQDLLLTPATDLAVLDEVDVARRT